MKRRDEEATIAQQFLSPDSYVTMDGRHVLKNEDWIAQKRLVWERNKGKCQYCGNAMHHAHHVIFRSDSRDDRISNLIGLCVECHRKIHPEKELVWSKTKRA